MDHKHDENDVCENCGGVITPEVEMLEKNFGTLNTDVEVYDKNHIVIQSVVNQYGHTVWYDNGVDDFFPGDHPVERLTLSFDEESAKELVAKLQTAIAQSESAKDDEPLIHAVPPPINERN
jgi:hypothetical protein